MIRYPWKQWHKWNSRTDVWRDWKPKYLGPTTTVKRSDKAGYVAHEGENLHRVRMFNLDRFHVNPGNPYWVSVNGKPTESVKDLEYARRLVEEKVTFFRLYDFETRPVIEVFRFYPFLGFVLQESRIG